MNIKDLQPGTYNPVVSTTTTKLNINSLPQGSFKPVTPTAPEEPELLKTIGQEILNPFERIGATVVNKVAPNVDTSKGILGNEIKPITSPSEFAGETIMGLSNFMGGGVVKEGAKVAAKSIFKRALPKIANVTKNVIVPGAKTGAVYGGGQSLERGDTIQEAIPNVAENAAYGGVGAAVLGAGLPAVAKPIVNTVRGAMRRATPEGRMAVAIENRANELEAINNNYVNMRKSTSFTPDSRKSNINRVAETDVLVNAVDENGLIRTKETGGAIDQYKALKLDGKESVVRANLERNQETARITDIKKKLDNVIQTGNLPIDEAEKARATNQVIVDALLREYPDGNVPLVRLHDEKIKVANLAYKNPDPSVRTKAKDIARGYKELVEDYSSFDVKAINKELAPIYEDIKFLQELDGKRVKGGKLSRNFAQISGNIIGGAVGNAAGGPFGAAIGAAAGGELASKVRGLALSKTLGRAVNKEIPKNTVLEKAKELSTKTGGIYSKIRGTRNLKYNTANTTNNTAMPRSVPLNKPQVKSDIPSAQSLRAFMKKEPVPEPPKKVELPGNQMIRDRMLKKAIDEQTANKVKPLYEPIVPDEKLPVIQAGGKTVSKFKKVDKALPTIQAGANRQAFGAVAGIKEDEQGNMTFDQKTAAMGLVAGNIAGRKSVKGIVKNISKDLAEVVKKFKSSKEFDDYLQTREAEKSPAINSLNSDLKTNYLLNPEEGVVYFHGTRAKDYESLLKNGFNPTKSTRKSLEQPEAMFVGDLTEAGMYGDKLVTVTLKTGMKAKTISISDFTAEENAKMKRSIDQINYARSKGYDAINVGDEIIILSPEKFEVGKTSDLFDKLKQGTNKTKDLLKKVGEKATEVYKEAGNLTTKILKDLEGKSTVSKQYILDATNRGELKQQERDLIRGVLDGEGDTVNVSDFAKKVQTELLPLNLAKGNKFEQSGSGGPSSRYERIALPKETRGEIKNYKENIYESPIKTSAGRTHFGQTSDNYFGHTRIEDMADDQTRRVIEVQSDLYQKGNLEREFLDKDAQGMKKYTEDYPNSPATPSYKEKYTETQNRLQKEKGKLQQYSNPTAHFRMVREEIKKASDDGKTKLQFPTGETAMKIEGLGSRDLWSIPFTDQYGSIPGRKLEPGDLQIDKHIISTQGDWVITEVLDDGKFRAVPKRVNDMAETHIKEGSMSVAEVKEMLRDESERFDISGKFDTNNPIYKFYEKDLGRYLTSKYGAKTITDDKGVNWYEVAIDKKKHGLPVEAFSAAPLALTGDDEEPGDSYMFTSKKSFSGETIERAPIEKEKLNTLEIMKAIENNESTAIGDKYTFHKFSGDKRYGDDLGKYQITSARLREKSKDFIGRKVSDKEFLASPYLQELFIEKQIRWLADRGLSPKEILAVHRNGWGDLSREAIDKAMELRKSYVDKATNLKDALKTFKDKGEGFKLPNGEVYKQGKDGKYYKQV